MLKTKSLDILKNAGIYLVTSSELSSRSTIDTVKEALDSGVKLVQLREKSLGYVSLLQLAKKIKKICDEYEAVLIINDFLELTLEIEADGVHLGQEDVSCKEARDVLGDNFIIGVSTHNEDEILKAQSSNADYINIGPVFNTKTKIHTKELGIIGLEKLIPLVKIPYTLMGGIKESNINLIKDRPSAFAMITEITKAKDISLKIKNLFGLIRY